MQDSNPRGASTPTTVFETAALPGSANPPATPSAPSRRAPGVAWSRCQESNLVRRLIRALHRPPCSTSCVYLRVLRRARDSNARREIPDLGLAIRCLTRLSQPSIVRARPACSCACASGRSRTCKPRTGRAGLSRVRQPVAPQRPFTTHQLPGEDSNLGLRIQSPASMPIWTNGHRPGCSAELGSRSKVRTCD